MKRIVIFSLFLVVLVTHVNGQLSPDEIKRIKEQLVTANHDSVRGPLTFQLAFGYRFSNIDSSLFYSDQTIVLADKNNLPFIRAQMLSLKGATLLEAGKIPESLQFQFEALGIGEEINDTITIAFALNRIGNIYMELADYKKATEYYNLSKDLFLAKKDTSMYHNEMSNIGNVYELRGMPDSALYNLHIVNNANKLNNDRNIYVRPEIMFRMGNAYKSKGNWQEALFYYRAGIAESIIDNDLRNRTMNYLFMARLYNEMGLWDSSILHARNALATGQEVSFRKGIYGASMLISELFKSVNKFDSAYKYLILANTERDSLTGNKRFQELQRIILNEQERQREAETIRIADQNRQRQIILLAGLGIFLVIATILFRNNKQKQKANKTLENTLVTLQATQSQLIQSEKMASLGELTAGIAHEIQNPLNFVNNFSEVNTELIDELQQEANKGNLETVQQLSKDIKDNEQKINHHGKRADAIVKGMLLHSRSSSGVKEPTDINALADEYLRLAYHGLRAKDKSFNATMKTDFDPAIGSIPVIPQDLGRVILNLITNAFYAVTEKKKQLPAGQVYEPTVSVSTRKSVSRVEIKVRDNGNGIPGKALEKIFQPFFTTKPTGQGTGLGLSLSYDIIKAHGGELKVNTAEGEYAEFVIILPL